MALAPDGAEHDEFGFSVALSGDTALIGAYAAEQLKGSAYIFRRSGGSWVYSAKLTASDGAANDAFGWSVALSADTAVIGAPGFGESQSPGAAYVFSMPSGGWATSTETAKLSASGGVAGDGFGESVALHGDAVLIGAPLRANSTGLAYLFVKPDGGWSTTSSSIGELSAASGTAGSMFGNAVALSNDTALITAPGDDSFAGSAYVFTKPETGWVTSSAFDAKLTSSDRSAGQTFGGSLSTSGGNVLIGAVGDADGAGAAYLFTKPEAGWSTGTETAKLTASDAAPLNYFGVSVALLDDTAFVGAHGVSSFSGATYVFARPAGSWSDTTETSKLTASDASNNSDFGWSLAATASTLLVGARTRDNNATVGQGAAYFYSPRLVTNTNDSGPGSLRQAIADAAAGETIAFDPSLAGETIRLASALAVDKTLTINGQALMPHVTVSGDTDLDGLGDVPLMTVSAQNVRLISIDFVDGKFGAVPLSLTGGIYNTGSLTIRDSTFSGNYGNGGGAIQSEGTLEISDSAFIDNSANEGGAILIGTGGVVTIAQSTFSNNRGVPLGAMPGDSGAIVNAGKLTVQDSVFTGNYGPLGGGAISNAFGGTVAITGSEFSSNSTDGYGGAIFQLEGSLTVASSSFSHNSAENGGAINAGMPDGSTYPYAAVTIMNSAFHDNTAVVQGGAISLNPGGAASSIAASTFDGNTADAAGALLSFVELSVENSTFFGNSATNTTPGAAGGIINPSTATLTKLTLKNNTFSGNSGGAFVNLGAATIINNILANSTNGPDCLNMDAGSIVLNTGNLIESGGSCGTPALSADPLLGPLADNGGPTFTMALQPGSPAIDTGTEDGCPATDQRGVTRPQGPHCDMGAFELQGPLLAASPNARNFGIRKLGTTTSQVFTLSNPGSADLHVDSLSLGGTNPGQFHISADLCTGSTLAPDSSCAFAVSFTPTRRGSLSASLMIPSDAYVSPGSLSLSGYGASERLVNGGFNNYPTGSRFPSHWAAWNFASTDGKTTLVKQEGTASVKITGQAGKTKTLKQTVSISGTANDQLKFSFWVRTKLVPTAGLCRAQVILYDGNAPVATQSQACPTGTSAFSSHNITFQAPGHYTSAVVIFTYSKSSGQIWFDAVSLLK